MLSRADFYVSFANEDRGVVAALCDSLHSYGISTFPGADLKSSSERLTPQNSGEALIDSDQLLVIVSEDAIQSEKVRNDIQRAQELKKQIYVLSLLERTDTEQLIKQSRLEALMGAEIQCAPSLRRTLSGDRYDKCVREFTLSLRQESKFKTLRWLAMACVLAGVLAYSSEFLRSTRQTVSIVKTRVAEWWEKPASIKAPKATTPSPVKVGRKDQPVPRPTPVVPSQKANSPAAPSPQVFTPPTFLKNPTLSIRQRLMGQWSASAKEQSMSVQIRHSDDLLLGRVIISGLEQYCDLSVVSREVRNNVVIFGVEPGPSNCRIRNLHVGYLSNEKILIVTEGEGSSMRFERPL